MRRDGLAQDREEVTAGLVCFAAYVGVTPLGKRLAVSTSIPSDRLDNAHRQAAIAGIRQVGRELAKLTAALP